jgi:hypothetical protein
MPSSEAIPESRDESFQGNKLSRSWPEPCFDSRFLGKEGWATNFANLHEWPGALMHSCPFVRFVVRKVPSPLKGRGFGEPWSFGRGSTCGMAQKVLPWIPDSRAKRDGPRISRIYTNGLGARYHSCPFVRFVVQNLFWSMNGYGFGEPKNRARQWIFYQSQRALTAAAEPSRSQPSSWA